MVSEDDSEDDISLRQLIQLSVTTFHIDSAVAMSANDFVRVDNTAELFSDMTDDVIVSQVINQHDTNPTETHNHANETNTISEPMPSKGMVNSALAVLLRTTEGTKGMTRHTLVH